MFQLESFVFLFLFCFVLFCVCVCFCYRAFEIVPDPKVQEITYFCPPGLSDLVRHSTSFLHEVSLLHTSICSFFCVCLLQSIAAVQSLCNMLYSYLYKFVIFVISGTLFRHCAAYCMVSFLARHLDFMKIS